MKKFIFICITLFGLNLSAYEFGLTLGIQTTDLEADFGSTSESADSVIGFAVGFLGFVEIDGPLLFRTGGVLTQRNFEFDTNTLTTEYELLYLDVPATVLYMFNDQFAVFGGLELGLNLSDDCSRSNGTSCLDVDYGVLFALDFGAHVRIVPNIAIELSYQSGLTDVGEVENTNTEFTEYSGINVSGIYLF